MATALHCTLITAEKYRGCISTPRIIWPLSPVGAQIPDTRRWWVVTWVTCKKTSSDISTFNAITFVSSGAIQLQCNTFVHIFLVLLVECSYIFGQEIKVLSLMSHLVSCFWCPVSSVPPPRAPCVLGEDQDLRKRRFMMVIVYCRCYYYYQYHLQIHYRYSIYYTIPIQQQLYLNQQHKLPTKLSVMKCLL